MWTAPAEVKALKNAGSQWVEYATGEGKSFYYNLVTKESRYDRPQEMKDSGVCVSVSEFVVLARVCVC